MLTQAQLLRLSEPLEDVYISAAEKTLVNTASFFDGVDKDMTPNEWRLRMLSQINKLSDETIRIIAAETGVAPELLIDGLQKAARANLDSIDSILQRAVEKGAIDQTIVSQATGDRIAQLLQALATQADERLSLVNSTMVETTISAYTSAVNIGASQANAILSKAALSGTIGTQSIQNAVSGAIKAFLRAGITGFVDSAGRTWTPEAYVNMVTRTTMHNAAIQATQIEAAGYGVHVFQVSSHKGARPLCAPYQGRFYSWGATGGTVYDLYDNPIAYEPLSATSYGEPAGLFGINCGHFPIPFVDRLSLPYSSAQALETEKEREADARLYKLFQRQRALERRVRETRRAQAAYKAAGLDEDAKKAKDKANAQKLEYQDFCEANNLTPRMDRLSITTI